MASADVDEINKIRKAVGLPLLPSTSVPSDDGPAFREHKSDEDSDAEHASTLETREAAGYQNFKQAQDEERRRLDREKRKQQIQKARDTAARFTKLEGKGLGESEENGDLDAKAWLKGSKKRQAKLDRERAERLAEELAELIVGGLPDLDLRELRELRDELEIVHRLQRVLIGQLRQDDLQERLEPEAEGAGRGTLRARYRTSRRRQLRRCRRRNIQRCQRAGRLTRNVDLASARPWAAWPRRCGCGPWLDPAALDCTERPHTARACSDAGWILGRVLRGQQRRHQPDQSRLDASRKQTGRGREDAGARCVEW